MARVQLTLQPGVDSVDTSYAEEGRYRDNSNSRFWMGKPQAIGGWQSVLPTLLTGVCRAILPWTDNAGDLIIAAATHTNLQVVQDSVLYDITPTGFTPGLADGVGGPGYSAGQYSEGEYSDATTGAYYPLTWSLAQYGQNLMACPRGGQIYWWKNSTSTPAAPLTSDAPAGTPGPPLVTTYNPLCIRECDVQDPTDWNPTSTNLASETILDGTGTLVGARVVGLDVIFAWTDTGLYAGTWTGEASQPRAWTLVARGCGLIGPNAVVVVGQTAYWMDPSCQLWSCAIGGAPAVLPCPIIEGLTDNLPAAQVDKIVASSCLQFQEIKWTYPDARDGSENSRSLVMSLISSEAAEVQGQTMLFWWDRLARTAYVDAKPAPYGIAATAQGNLYYHECGATADGASFESFVESADQYLADSQQVMAIMGFWPDFQDQQGPINVYITVRQYPQAPETTYGPYPCTPPVNGMPGTSKIDLRISGRLARIRVAASAAPTAWRLGLPAFDITPAGGR